MDTVESTAIGKHKEDKEDSSHCVAMFVIEVCRKSKVVSEL